MTAPPAQMPLVSFSDSHMHAAAAAATAASSTSYLSPTSTASDSPFSWTSMAPLQNLNRPPSQPKSMSPETTNESNANSSELLFITGTTLEEFRSKTNMTKVRKKAMGSYLEREKKPRDMLKEREQRSREDSTGSEQQQDVMSNSEAIRIWKGEKGGRRHASLPTEHVAEKKTDMAEMQVSLMPKISIGFVLPSAPIVLPMRTGVRLPYDDTAPRPFQSIGKPLDPFRTIFQASHPQVSVEELKWHCSQSFGSRAMGIHWVPTLIKSPHAFLSTLCIASAHYDAVKERPIESVQTLALRQEVMHLISQNLLNSRSRVDDHNIIALTQLIASEIITGEEKALGYNEQGVEAMIKQRGGIDQLGVNGRLASTVSWVSLESAVLREAKPDAIYLDYSQISSSKNYPSTATIPESPLYCPRDEFETIRRSQCCIPKTLELLKEIRMMMDLFIHETNQSRRNSLSLKNIYKKIISRSNFPSAADLRKTNVLTANDYKYEAVRMVAILIATAIMHRVSLSDALKYAADIENQASIYASETASKSSESLSPKALRHDSPCTSFSTSPSYATASVSTSTYQNSNPFVFQPAPTAASRPSFPSTTSVTSHFPAFPSSHQSTLSGPLTLLTNLKGVLQNSDLSNCWGDMAGVLLWVALTVGAASRQSGDKVLKKWFRALAIRTSILLCFEHPEAVHASLLRMGEVIEGVGYAASSNVISTKSEIVQRQPTTAFSKKRRV